MNYLLCSAILGLCAFLVRSFFVRPSLTFINGVRLGYSFFIGGPIAIVVLFGRIPQPALDVPPLTINSPSYTYAILFGVGFAIALLKRNWVIIGLKARSRFLPGRRFFALYIAIYVGSAIAYFLATGKLSGGHWYRSGAVLEESASAVYVANIWNVLRIGLPGISLYSLRRNIISNRVFVALMLFQPVFEFFISGNRILILLGGRRYSS